MKTILLTGATGFLGGYLLEKLMLSEKYQLFTISRSKEILEQRYNIMNIRNFDLEDLNNNSIPFENADVLIHLAFGRVCKGEIEVANSLYFTNQIFNKIIKFKIPQLINISTQEVYGKCYSIPWKEFFEPAPQSIYGIAKYASELFTKTVEQCGKIVVTNLRLPGLLSKETDTRMVNKLVASAINGNPIQIIGGSQLLSQLDVRDAVNGIIALLNVAPEYWKPIYNLGYLQSYNIIEIATIVANLAKEFNCPDVKINLNETDDTIYAELDSTLFYNDTKWRPQYNMEDIVRSIFVCQLSNKK
jgi:nucleoside-diphosphate-sugar epimerase